MWKTDFNFKNQFSFIFINSLCFYLVKTIRKTLKFFYILHFYKLSNFMSICAINTKIHNI